MNPALPALIGLTGVIIGGFIAFITNYFTKTKEAQLRIIEKIFDKRIKAHEDILQVSQKLRTTISLNKIDRDGNALTYPAILHAPEIFNDFKGLFYENTNSNVHWINIELFRELNYIQDYIETLTIHLQNIPANKYPEIALIIKNDIINIAADLENETRLFFDQDIYLIHFKTTKGHHKLPKAETVKRLEATLLLENRLVIHKMKE